MNRRGAPTFVAAAAVALLLTPLGTAGIGPGMAGIGSGTGAGGLETAGIGPGAGAPLVTPAAPTPLRADTLLTLDEALELAYRHNPVYRRALRESELADPARRQAFGAFLPTLTLSSGTGAGFNRRTIAEDIFGNPIENPEVRTAYTSDARQGLSMSLTVFEGGRRFHDIARARSDAVLRESEGELARVTLRAAVQGAFLTAQERQAMLELEESLLDARRRDLDATERLFALAERGRADLLGARFEIRQQERALENARGDLRLALLQLRTQMGDPGAVPAGVVPAPLPLFDPTELDVDALVAHASAESPAVAREAANRAVAQAGRSATRATRWPTVTLTGSTSRSAFRQNQDALFDLSPRDQTGGILSLNLSIPVFQRFETSFQIAQADVQALNADETLRERRIQVEEGVRSGILELETAFRTVRLEEESLELAEERLRIAREEYRLAGRSFDELQEPIRGADAARRQLLQARYDFARAVLNLEEAVGGPVGRWGFQLPAG